VIVTKPLVVGVVVMGFFGAEFLVVTFVVA
jgi:hypothetical protein